MTQNTTSGTCHILLLPSDPLDFYPKWHGYPETTHTHTQPFYGPLSGSTRVSRYQKKHSSTHTTPAHQPSLSASSIYHESWHPPCSIHAPGNLSARPLTVSSSAYLWVWSHTYSIHFFTQSLSSFHNTCPYHRNLFCCSSDVMSAIPSLWLIGSVIVNVMSQQLNKTCPVLEKLLTCACATVYAVKRFNVLVLLITLSDMCYVAAENNAKEAESKARCVAFWCPVFHWICVSVGVCCCVNSAVLKLHTLWYFDKFFFRPH